ncbi:hypothetical protein [Micromonospora sp. NPDC005189]|uniref:hypothetical protein n=1 Tax=unclassified Micromonospora TaxID=2617518 RepID=UPI0033B2FCF4
MTHPQPPFGPQDPQQPNPEPPTQPFPPTPQPQSAADPTVPQAPVPPNPWSAPASPQQPPFSGGAYPQQPPFSGGAYPQQPPFSGGAYPPPPGGPGYPPTMPPPAPTKNSKKTVVIVAVTVAILALLCCVGGITAVVVGANRAADEASEVEALPTPDVTRGVGQPPAPTPSSARPSATGETRNMSVGDTLVIDNSRGTIEITVTKFSTSTTACRANGFKPSKGLYVIADVNVRVTMGTASTNPLYFRWIAADGTTTTPISGTLSGCGTALPSGSGLTSGTTRTGNLVFNVADTNGVLEYRHEFRTAGTWKP